MSTNDNEKKEITFRYLIPDDLKDCYINGVWGMVSPKGEVNMHLYSERLPIPNTETHIITNGKLEPIPTERKIGGDVVRLIQSSVVMDIQTAIALQQWLGERIDNFIKIKEAEQKENDT